VAFPPGALVLAVAGAAAPFLAAGGAEEPEDPQAVAITAHAMPATTMSAARPA
jgi:hypothetical protein